MQHVKRDMDGILQAAETVLARFLRGGQPHVPACGIWGRLSL